MKLLKFGIPCFLVSILLITSSSSPKGDFYKLPKLLKDRYVIVPQTQDNAEGAFYMSKYEVSNLDYREFLYDLKAKGKDEGLSIAMLDTANWVKEFPKGFMKPFAKQYHKHPAYNNYPVVNVSLEGAKLYCEWLSGIWNEKLAEEEYRIKFMIPNRDQWLAAANGGREDAVYGWQGKSLRDEDGELKCNFKNLGAEHIYYDHKSKTYGVKTDIGVKDKFKKDVFTSDNAYITAPTESYEAGNFNIFNLNGNVAEWVSDGLACGGSWNSTGYDVRNQSAIKVEHSSCMVGFRPIMVFTKKSS